MMYLSKQEIDFIGLALAGFSASTDDGRKTKEELTKKLNAELERLAKKVAKVETKEK